jgi:integrase
LHERFMAMKEPAVSKATIDQYGYLWEKLEPRIGHMLIRKIKAAELDRAYAAILTSGVSANTTRKVHKHAVALLRQAVRWELVHRNVAESATPPAATPFEVVPPDADDLVTLVDAAFKQEQQFGALVYLGATTGARRGELAGLRWLDVDLDKGIVRFEHQPENDGTLVPLKNKRGRTVHIDDDTVVMLKEHQQLCEEVARKCDAKLTSKCFVFSPLPGNTDPYRKDGLTWRFRKLAETTGINNRLHDLRHAQATTLLANGVPAQVVAARLGHASATITMAVYAHSDAVQERAAAELGALRR